MDRKIEQINELKNEIREMKTDIKTRYVKTKYTNDIRYDKVFQQSLLNVLNKHFKELTELETELSEEV